MAWQFLAASSWNVAELILTGLIQSTVLLAVGLFAGRLVRSRGPAIQSALYRTTLTAVVLCPVASMVMAAMGFNGLMLQLPAPVVSAETVIANVPSDPGSRPSTDGDEPTAAHRVDDPKLETRQTFDSPTLPVIPPGPASESSAASPTVPITAMPVKRAASSRWTHLVGWGSMLVLAAWLLGASVLGARLGIGHRRMMRLRSSAIDAEPDVLSLCRNLARLMRLSPPAVLCTPFLSSPCLDGLRRPAILLPEDSEEHLRETFIHELAHLARRDGLWNLLRQSATALFWIQPLLWNLSKRLEVTAEEVCDDYVVQFGADRGRYAGHLLKLAERRLPPLAPSGVGMISLRSLLARRIARILDATRPISTRAGSRAILTTLAAGLAGTLLVGLLGVGAVARKAEAQHPPKGTEAHAPPEIRTIRGQVVGPDGKPFPGATVIAARGHRVPNAIGDDGNPDFRCEILMRKPADDQGRFELRLGQMGFPVLATAPGLGVGYYREGQPIRLRPGDLPINGRLIDLEGRPVAGGRSVSVRSGFPWGRRLRRPSLRIRRTRWRENWD